jgi:hypothetical protein
LGDVIHLDLVWDNRCHGCSRLYRNNGLYRNVHWDNGRHGHNRLFYRRYRDNGL